MWMLLFECSYFSRKIQGHYRNLKLVWSILQATVKVSIFLFWSFAIFLGFSFIFAELNRIKLKKLIVFCKSRWERYSSLIDIDNEMQNKSLSPKICSKFAACLRFAHELKGSICNLLQQAMFDALASRFFVRWELQHGWPKRMSCPLWVSILIWQTVPGFDSLISLQCLIMEILSRSLSNLCQICVLLFCPYFWWSLSMSFFCVLLPGRSSIQAKG